MGLHLHLKPHEDPHVSLPAFSSRLFPLDLPALDRDRQGTRRSRAHADRPGQFLVALRQRTSTRVGVCHRFVRFGGNAPVPSAAKANSTELIGSQRSDSVSAGASKHGVALGCRMLYCESNLAVAAHCLARSGETASYSFPKLRYGGAWVPSSKIDFCNAASDSGNWCCRA